MRTFERTEPGVADISAAGGRCSRRLDAPVLAFLPGVVHTERESGACLEGATRGSMNVGGQRWLTRHAHRTTWSAGCRLFSDLKQKGEAAWRHHAGFLGGFRPVEALPMDGAVDASA